MFLNNLFSQQNVKNRVICVWGGGKVLAKLRNYSFITENGSNCFAKIPVKAVFLHRVEVMYHLHCTFSSLFYFLVVKPFPQKKNNCGWFCFLLSNTSVSNIATLI